MMPQRRWPHHWWRLTFPQPGSNRCANTQFRPKTTELPECRNFSVVGTEKLTVIALQQCNKRLL
jgi:hypothetical protein